MLRLTARWLKRYSLCWIPTSISSYRPLPPLLQLKPTSRETPLAIRPLASGRSWGRGPPHASPRSPQQLNLPEVTPLVSITLVQASLYTLPTLVLVLLAIPTVTRSVSFVACWLPTDGSTGDTSNRLHSRTCLYKGDLATYGT